MARRSAKLGTVEEQAVGAFNLLLVRGCAHYCKLNSLENPWCVTAGSATVICPRRVKRLAVAAIAATAAAATTATTAAITSGAIDRRTENAYFGHMQGNDLVFLLKYLLVPDARNSKYEI
ncbi:hypothetical protein M0804_004139 [Polistes exclamans]|nr:hypothetical protein M0804_004139 [Polistes exclamans]